MTNSVVTAFYSLVGIVSIIILLIWSRHRKGEEEVGHLRKEDIYPHN